MLPAGEQTRRTLHLTELTFPTQTNK